MLPCRHISLGERHTYGTDQKGGTSVAYSDQELLARIIECEAGGEGDTGMKAVACVVMNRVQVDYGEYGRLHTIR